MDLTPEDVLMVLVKTALTSPFSLERTEVEYLDNESGLLLTEYSGDFIETLDQYRIIIEAI